MSAFTAQLETLYKANGHSYDWCLIFDVPETGHITGLTVMYDSGMYDAEGIQNVPVHAERVQTAMLATPGAVAANVNLLNDMERDFVVNKLNNFEIEYPKVGGKVVGVLLGAKRGALGLSSCVSSHVDGLVL